MTSPRRWPLALLVFVSLVVTLAACTGSDSSSTTTTTEVVGFRPGGTLRLGVLTQATLDPARIVPTDQAGMIAADLLFDSLTTDDNPAAPALAASVTPNGDLMQWTVGLGDHRFADGSPVTAADVKYSFERLAAQGSASVAGARLDIIAGYQAFAVDKSATELTGVAVVDDRTVRFTLNEPYSQFAELVGSPLYGIVPKAVVTTVGDEAFGASPVGSGPYAFGSRDGSTVHLVRAAGPAGEAVGPDGVDLVQADTLAASYAAFGAGQVDWALVPNESLAEATTKYGGGAFVPFGATQWFGINETDPTYADPRFRQAIVQAVNRDAIVQAVYPGRIPFSGLVAQGVPGFVQGACGAACAYDPGAAKALLLQAFPEGTPLPTVTIDLYDDPTQKAVADAMQKDLEYIGLPVQQRVQPFADYQAFVVSGQAGVFSYGWVGINATQEAYLGPPFLSKSADNVVGLQSDVIDAQIRAGRAATDPAQRQAIYQELERELLGFGAVVPIAQLRTNQVLAPRVQGFSPRLDGTFDTASLWLAD